MKDEAESGHAEAGSLKGRGESDSVREDERSYANEAPAKSPEIAMHKGQRNGDAYFW